MNRLSIALVTPWPPEHSGIADFAFDLAIGLRDAGHAVTVHTRCPVPQALQGVEVVQVPVGWTGDSLSGYPLRLYQLGNNVEFHGWMLPAMSAQPGVVQIHDIVLHHLLVGMTCARGNWSTYVAAVRDWYGPSTAERAEAPLHRAVKPIWETEDVAAYPFFPLFIENAQGLIVHSLHAARRIAHELPRIPLLRVMQTYRDVEAPPRTTLRRIGVFGGVQENKKIDWLIEAFGYLDRFLEGIEVTVVGTVVPQCEGLVEKAKALRHLSIRFIGRVDEAEFLEELARTDLCISLRHPTMGETSAVVMRAVQMGIPTIVSDTGWYAELPTDVLKAPLDNTPHFLSSTLHDLITQPKHYRDWARACATLPQRLGLRHSCMIEDIVTFLQTYRADRYVLDVVAAKLADMGFVGDDSEHDVLATLASKARLS